MLKTIEYGHMFWFEIVTDCEEEKINFKHWLEIQALDYLWQTRIDENICIINEHIFFVYQLIPSDKLYVRILKNNFDPINNGLNLIEQYNQFLQEK